MGRTQETHCYICGKKLRFGIDDLMSLSMFFDQEISDEIGYINYSSYYCIPCGEKVLDVVNNLERKN